MLERYVWQNGCAVVALRGLGGGFVAENRRWRLPRCTAGAAAAAGEGQRAGGESKALSWPVGKDHIKVLLSEMPGARILN